MLLNRRWGTQDDLQIVPRVQGAKESRVTVDRSPGDVRFKFTNGGRGGAKL